VVVNGDGTVSYTHDGSETNSDIFTYTIRDAGGNVSNTATVSLVAIPVNDAPTLAINAGATVAEGGNIALTASVLPRGMAACTSSAPALDLELVSTDGRSLIGSVVAAPGVCPEIIGTEPFATGLAAGDYALRLVPSDNDVSRFEYDLTIDVSVP